MALFDNNKDTKEKGSNISQKIGKDISKKKSHKTKRRGMTKNSYIKNDNKEKKDCENDIKISIEDKYMDIDQK